MIKFVSTKGGIAPVDFETAVTSGFASDGGLFVPESIPKVTKTTMEKWSDLGFVELAYEILSLYMDESVIPPRELKLLLENSFSGFENPEIAPVVPLGKNGNLFVMELFHGPTLSFKDMAMGFLINIMDYFLKKQGGHKSLLVATTGDTGPAAAHACVGKKTIDCWVLFPNGFISQEQERQITTLEAPNVHAVGVDGCKDGGDDLDRVVARLFSDEKLRDKLHLSSVNSINWCRVMAQAIHYFYAYFKVANTLDDRIVFSVPTGAFGNLFGGFLARAMGLPVHTFVCANNKNAALHRVFETGVFSKADLQQTVSSAIDIVLPYNFWRYLYFASGNDHEKIRNWMRDFKEKGEARLDSATYARMKSGFSSAMVSDETTLSTITDVFHNHDQYLIDPHTAVAVAAAKETSRNLGSTAKTVCLATAHPAKFPDIIQQALNHKGGPPSSAVHPSIEKNRELCRHVRLCHHDHLQPALVHSMGAVVRQRKGMRSQGTASALFPGT